MSKRIDILRSAVVVGMVAAAIVFGTVSYVLLAAYEKQAVTSRFSNIADYALDALNREFGEKRNSVLTLSKAMNAQHSNQTEWPNVVMPGFYDVVPSLRDATGLGDMFIVPLVIPEKLPDYKNYFRAYLDSDPAIPAGSGMPGLDVWGLKDLEVYDEITGEPRIYRSPNNLSAPLIQFLFDGDFGPLYFGLNLHSLKEFGPSIDAVIECSKLHTYTEAIHVCTNISAITPMPINVPESQVTGFHSSLIQPIYLNHNSSQLVGFAGGGFDWRTLLYPLFATSNQGVEVVIINSDIEYTFTTASGGLKIKGFGDLHDRHYNHYRREAVMFASTDSTENAVTYKVCIYPTDYFFETYTTSTPIFAAVGSALLMLLCGATFYFYDHFTRKAAAANEAVLETKRRFVRFISHEIRTPLNAVHLGLEALTSEVGRAIELMFKSSQEGAAFDFNSLLSMLRSWLELSTEMMGNSESAVDVLNDLLNYDKIEMGTLRLEFSAAPIWEIVKSATVGFLTPSKQRGIHMSLDNNLSTESDCDADNNQFVIVGDYGRLAQVMRNLISNSIKFTPAGGTIAIHVEKVTGGLPNPSFVIPAESATLLQMPRAGSVRISVTDSGVGLSSDQLSQICSEGVQFNANELQAGKGSGLGLFITKGIVEQHGGKLTVTSAGIGSGTTFSIELPLFYRVHKRPPPPMHLPRNQIAPENSAQLDLTGQCETPMSGRLSDNGEVEVGFSHERVEQVKRILVVDDASSNRKMLIRILTSSGYECEQAEDGQQAIDVYRASLSSGKLLYSIIMDYEMPVMNGPTATKKLRELGCKLPILGVTGNLLPSDVTYYKAQGANQVFGKPLNLARFEEFLRDHEERCALEIEARQCSPVPGTSPRNNPSALDMV